MKRFFVPPELCRADAFDLPEREARHAVQVLRLAPGDQFTVLDGAGSVIAVVVDSASRRSLRVVVRERVQHPQLPCAITLVQAIPKSPAFDSIIQKATELGAARIIPLLSERVVVQLGEKEAGTKVEKWRQIAIESIKQCGSPWLPQIDAPLRIESALKNPPPAEVSVVCSLEERSRTVREVVAEFESSEKREPKSAALWIGPEGDFTPTEYAAIARQGVTPVTLGPLVLRADTAAIAALAVANHELQSY